MKVVAHISDLHFGTNIPEVTQALLSSLEEVLPDLLVVSGDLTQRATALQFQDARDFLAKIRFPQVVVPGNHDITLYNVFRRYFRATTRYQEYISSDLSPFFLDREIAVLGINTARSFTWKNGRISLDQMHLIRERFCSVPPGTFKILVTHHPFVAPPGQENETVVGRAERMFLLAEGCNPDMALAGHFHMSYSANSHSVYTAQKGSTLVVQAGTAISRRTRLERNAYNVLEVEREQVNVRVYMWDGLSFEVYRLEKFRRSNNLWEMIKD